MFHSFVCTTSVLQSHYPEHLRLFHRVESTYFVEVAGSSFLLTSCVSRLVIDS